MLEASSYTTKTYVYAGITNIIFSYLSLTMGGCGSINQERSAVLPGYLS